MQYDVVVIGSGPGGYVAAIRAAQLGLKTICIEKERVVGGTCLNVGCIPSKCLLHSSHFYAECLKGGETHGIELTPHLNFAKMTSRKNRVVEQFNRGIRHLFRKQKITFLQGEARFLSPTTIAVGNEKITGTSFILATGSAPTTLPFLPFDEKRVLSSTGALALTEVPKKMAVIGAGVIGVELGSVYSRLGCHVQLFEFLETACPMLDRDLSRELQKTLEKQGMSFHFQTKVTQAQVSLNRVLLTIETAPQPPYQIEFDKVIVAVGRRPYSDNLGLEEIGIAKDQRGFISVDQNFRTAHSHIYAIGDLIGGAMLAHKASEEGIAVAEFLAGETPHISYATIPNVVYTHPEAASVGLTEKEAKEYGISYQTALFPLQGNSRAACMGETDGLFKLIVEKEKGMLLGAHLLSPSAGELIGQLALAIEKRMSIRDLSHLSFAHPTLAEGIKEAALGVFGSFLHL